LNQPKKLKKKKIINIFMDKIPILSIILMKEPDLNNVISRELLKIIYLFLFIQYGTKWTFTPVA
jgi:hypothetical protein